EDPPARRLLRSGRPRAPQPAFAPSAALTPSWYIEFHAIPDDEAKIPDGHGRPSRGGVAFRRSGRRGPPHLRALHRRGPRRVLPLRARDLLPGDHDGDDGHDVRSGRQRLAPPDGRVSLAD